MSWRSREQFAKLASGQTIHVVQPTPVDPWTAWLDHKREAALSGRWLLGLICEVAEVPPGRAPDWAFALVDEFAGRETVLGLRFPCPCCDFLTLDRLDSSRTCPVCGWEDDLVQLKDPDRAGGANRPSLREARDSYTQRGFAKDVSAGRVRPPLAAEQPPE